MGCALASLDHRLGKFKALPAIAPQAVIGLHSAEAQSSMGVIFNHAARDSFT